MKRPLSALTLFITCALLITSCGGNSDVTDAPTEEISDAETVTDAPQTDEVEDNTVFYINPLTGIADLTADLTDKRPVAVVLKNDKNGAPQFGIADADVVYEAAVEGGMTRLLALYSDYPSVGKIGPVIDARAPFYRIADVNDAVIVKAGTTSYAKTVQKQLNVDSIDAIVGEMAPLFERNKELIDARGYSSSILLDPLYLTSEMRSDDISTSRSDDSQLPMSFESTEYSLSSNDYCMKLTVPYSSASVPYFEYSTLTNSYTRYQFGNVHADADGTVLKYKNVLVLLTDHSVTDSTTGEMDIDILAGGDGYYVSSGRYVEIKWSIDAESGVFKFTDLNTTELKLSPGNTFVSILSDKMKSKITFN